jgi:hypothetical protein
MLNKAPVFVNGFQRGGTNIFDAAHLVPSPDGHFGSRGS